MGWVSAISKLIEFFAKLKQKDMNSLTVVVMGKGGVGKSSTVNSLIGEQVVRVSPFQAEGLRPVMVSKTFFLFASSLHSLHIILKYKTPTNKNDVLDQAAAIQRHFTCSCYILLVDTRRTRRRKMLM